MGEERKYNLPVITAEVYKLDPDRYEIRKGNLPDAPPCPFGHRFKWIGYDKEDKKYVRVTKSIFKKMINELNKDIVEKHESDFDNEKQ